MNKWYTPCIGVALFAGIFYFLIHQKMLIISFYKPSYELTTTSIDATKKQSTLYFYHHGTWQQEATEFVWPHDQAQALSYTANRWLSTAYEEDVMAKKVTVSHACITQDGKGYISFDQSPFEAQQSTRDKFFLIQGLLKSIKATKLPLSGIYFLLNHKPLTDYHLDFSIPWSLEPYCS